MCWLTDMLPPTIEITSGSCGTSPELSQEEQDELEACNIDANKNGVSDCIAEKIV